VSRQLHPDAVEPNVLDQLGPLGVDDRSALAARDNVAKPNVADSAYLVVPGGGPHEDRLAAAPPALRVQLGVDDDVAEQDVLEAALRAAPAYARGDCA
jgi:hypothetical protein